MSLIERCPLFGVSSIGGSTVHIIWAYEVTQLYAWHIVERVWILSDLVADTLPCSWSLGFEQEMEETA